MKNNKKEIGKLGENIAIKYLQSNGYEILDKNWTKNHLEIDIISKKDSKLIITEVKTRNYPDIETPREAIPIKKQRFLVKAANQYIIDNDIHFETRFDVIIILLTNSDFELEHIEDAFYPIA